MAPVKGTEVEFYQAGLLKKHLFSGRKETDLTTHPWHRVLLPDRNADVMPRGTAGICLESRAKDSKRARQEEDWVPSVIQLPKLLVI